jgi:hypothetical protein
MICQLGTFDVENYGDLLYPIVFRHLAKTKDPNLDVRAFSLLAVDAPHQAGFRTEPIRSLFEKRSEDTRSLVIGGGDILRTDWDLMARHYGRSSRASLKALRQSIGISGAVGYAVRERTPRLEPGSFYARRFRARWMNYPAAGPFLMDPKNLPEQSVVAYVSCGVPHEFAAGEADRVRETFAHANFISLRDEQSAEKLRAAGVACELHVAPDLTVTLSDQFEREALMRRARAVLARVGAGEDRPFICIQSQPYPGFHEDDILSELKLYKQRREIDVIALPLGYCHGDHEFLQSLAKRSRGMVKYAAVDSIFDMLAIIAASELFIGTSLHGNITAFSYGVPHVFGPLPVSKAEGFLRVANLPGDLKMRSWNELNDRSDVAMVLGREFFRQKAQEAKARTYQVIDEFMNVLIEKSASQ